MLKNAYLDAKIGVDAAENEPSKVRGFLMGVGGVIIAARARALLVLPAVTCSTFGILGRITT